MSRCVPPQHDGAHRAAAQEGCPSQLRLPAAPFPPPRQQGPSGRQHAPDHHGRGTAGTPASLPKLRPRHPGRNPEPSSQSIRLCSVPKASPSLLLCSLPIKQTQRCPPIARVAPEAQTPGEQSLPTPTPHLPSQPSRPLAHSGNGAPGRAPERQGKVMAIDPGQGTEQLSEGLGAEQHQLSMAETRDVSQQG